MLDVVISAASYTGLQIKGAASQSGGFLNLTDSNNNTRVYIGNLGDVLLYALPATAGVSAGSPSQAFSSTYWNGSASVSENCYIANARYGGGGGSAGAYRMGLGCSSSNPDTFALNIAGDGSNVTSINYPYPKTATDAQFYVLNGSATRKGLVVQGAASQSDSLLELQDSGATSLFTVNSAGAVTAGTWNGGVISATYGGTGLSALGTGVATWLGTPSSANLATALTDETGTGASVFAASPTLSGTVSVSGNIQMTAGSAQIEFNAGGSRLFGYANSLAFHTGGGLGSTANEMMRMTATGLGIGTTTPTAKLDVQGSAEFGTSNIALITSAGKITGLSSTYFGTDTSANFATIRLMKVVRDSWRTPPTPSSPLQT